MASGFLEKLGWASSANGEEDTEMDDYDGFDDSADVESTPDFLSSVTPMSRPSVISGRSSSTQGMSRIRTAHPRTYGDVEKIAKWLCEGIPVIVNLAETADQDCRRIVDFCVGVTYALGGTHEQIHKRVLVFTPESVRIDSADSRTDRSSSF